MRRSLAAVLSPLALALLAPSLTACAQSPRITIDGEQDDWPLSVTASADASSIFVRFSPDETLTLQGGQRCTRVLFDLDADATTGLHADSLGVDLEIQISPLPSDKGAALALGARAYAHAGGQRRTLAHTDVALEFAPTYAASDYELRISRGFDPDDARGVPALSRLWGEGRVRGVVVQTDNAGAPLWRGESFEVVLPAPRARRPSAGPVPPPAGALRVVSHNVLHASPERAPDAFARLYTALSPDVVLVQEWDAWNAARLEAWFDEHAPSETGWHAVAHPGDRAGVAVISRYPIIHAVDEPVHAQGSGWPVRFVGAVIDAPGGPLLAGSIHLKCCGFAGSPEDEQRKREARAINDHVRRVLDEHGIERCVLGGDLNLVGSRPPLDILRASLDADDTDLATVSPLVWGERTTHTWTDDKSAFTPGRLDWVVYSDAVLDNTFACVVESAALSHSARAAMGLEADDSRASDHLPIVVDLAPMD